MHARLKPATVLLFIVCASCCTGRLSAKRSAKQATLDASGEMLSSYKAPYSETYDEITEVSLETVCDSMMQILSAFGNQSLQVYDQCPNTYELLGPKNSQFEDLSELPECLTNIDGIFCNFELKYDGIPIAAALFDFIASSIAHCMKVQFCISI